MGRGLDEVNRLRRAVAAEVKDSDPARARELLGLARRDDENSLWQNVAIGREDDEVRDRGYEPAARMLRAELEAARKGRALYGADRAALDAAERERAIGEALEEAPPEPDSVDRTLSAWAERELGPRQAAPVAPAPAAPAAAVAPPKGAA